MAGSPTLPAGPGLDAWLRAAIDALRHGGDDGTLTVSQELGGNTQSGTGKKKT